ncbi:hypothetical protein ISCGN_019506 [Ixodes scapularis]
MTLTHPLNISAAKQKKKKEQQETFYLHLCDPKTPTKNGTSSLGRTRAMYNLLLTIAITRKISSPPKQKRKKEIKKRKKKRKTNLFREALFLKIPTVNPTTLKMQVVRVAITHCAISRATFADSFIDGAT